MNVFVLMDGGECYTSCAQSMCRIPVLPVACEIERTGDKYTVLGRNTIFNLSLSIYLVNLVYRNIPQQINGSGAASVAVLSDDCCSILFSTIF